MTGHQDTVAVTDQCGHETLIEALQIAALVRDGAAEHLHTELVLMPPVKLVALIVALAVVAESDVSAASLRAGVHGGDDTEIVPGMVSRHRRLRRTRIRPSCGTHAGYNTHRYHKEQACTPCQEAERIYSRTAKRRQTQTDRR